MTQNFVSVVNLSIQDNTKLLQQSKSGFKRTARINVNKSSNRRTKPILR